jgi:transcriptional regulator with XRE-family HTH domain
MDISYKELSDRSGISTAYAWQILSGDRVPSLAKAFQIYDATGLQFGILKGLPKKTIEQLRPNSSDQEEAA